MTRGLVHELSGGSAPTTKVSIPDILGRKQAASDLAANGSESAIQRLAMVTAYDFTMARLADEAGVDIVLVGDSLGMVVQGFANTLPVTVDEVCYHGRAVARGLARAHLVGDMPFMSYQTSAARALESAGKLLKEGAFESVKLEGGEEVADLVWRITRAGIPVMGHVGLQPQRVHALGGFRMQGRGTQAAAKIVADAQSLERAGAYAIVLEAVPPDVAAEVTRSVGVPTLGIGAGAACDGQVLVCTDLLGMSRGAAPRFAKRYAEVGDVIVGAMRAYVREVRSGKFPAPQHAYQPNGPRVEPGRPGDRPSDGVDAK